MHSSFESERDSELATEQYEEQYNHLTCMVCGVGTADNQCYNCGHSLVEEAH